jgi:hypothetical protein
MGKPRLRRGFYLVRCYKSHSTQAREFSQPKWASRKEAPHPSFGLCRAPRFRSGGTSVTRRHTESRHGKRGNIEAKNGREIGEPQTRGRAGALRFLGGEPVARGKVDRATTRYVRAFKR